MSRNPAVAARLNLMKNDAPSDAVQASIDGINVVFKQFADDLVTTVEGHNGYDVGRLIAAVDKLTEARNVAVDALRLVAVKK